MRRRTWASLEAVSCDLIHSQRRSIFYFFLFFIVFHFELIRPSITSIRTLVTRILRAIHNNDNETWNLRDFQGHCMIRTLELKIHRKNESTSLGIEPSIGGHSQWIAPFSSHTDAFQKRWPSPSAHEAGPKSMWFSRLWIVRSDRQFYWKNLKTRSYFGDHRDYRGAAHS